MSYLTTTLLYFRFIKNVLLIKSDIRHFFIRSKYEWKLRYNYVAFSFFQFSVSFSTPESHYKCFWYNDIFSMTLGLRFLGTFALRMEMTLQLRFIFVRHCDVFFISSQFVIYLFDVVMFFDNVRVSYILVSSNYVWK